MTRAALRLIAAWTLGNVGYRIAMVALPLLAVAQTGSAWTVGLVAGSAGVPVITAPWWTRGLQRRLTSARQLRRLMVAEGLVSLAVPAAAAMHGLTPLAMIGVGLSTGVLNAVSGPLDASLLATIGDRRDVDRGQPATGRGAARMLATQDGTIKAATTMAPLAALVLIASIGLVATVAADGLLTLVGALCLIGLRLEQPPATPDEPPHRVRALLRGHRTIALGLGVRAAGCAAWFAFTLCLALVGEAQGNGVRLATVGLTCYSASAVLGALLGVAAAGASRPAVLNGVSWLLAGIGWVLIGGWPSMLVTGVVAACMGLVVPAGNAATTALVTRTFGGTERRSMLTAQATVVTGSTTLGMLVGGPLIAFVGPATAIWVAGSVVATIAASAVLEAVRHDRRLAGTPGPAERDAGERERLGTAVHTTTRG